MNVIYDIGTDVRFVGPAEDIKKLKAELEAAGKFIHFQYMLNNKSTENDAYPAITGYFLDTDVFHSVIPDYPRVEYCCTKPDKFGEVTYCYKNLGETKHSEGYLYDDEAENWPYYQGFERITATFLELRKSPTVNPLVTFSREGLPEWKDRALSFPLIMEFCHDVKTERGKENFMKHLFSKISSLSNVRKITVKMMETVSAASDNLQAYQIIERCRPFLPDPSLLNYIFATVKKKVTLVYDLDTMQVTQTESVYVRAPECPLENKLTYVDYPVSEGTKTYPIPGSSENNGSLLFSNKTEKTCACTAVLSDIETLVIPENDWGKVEALGDKCIMGLNNVKKVILPCTLTSFGAGNFKNCKQLKQVSFADAPDSKDALVIRKKTTLNGVVTLQKSFDVPADITEIGKFAFASCPKLTEIRLQSDIKKINKEAFCDCYTLKTLVLTDAVRTFDIKVLENSRIREVVLPNGVKIDRDFMFPYIISGEQGVTFSYAELAKNFKGIGMGTKRLYIAKKVFFEQAEFAGDSLSAFAEYLLEYAICQSDVDLVNQIIEKNLPLTLDFTKLVEISQANGATEISSILISLRNQEHMAVKNVRTVETPAPKAKNPFYVKVRFPHNRTYAYSCHYQVDIGDKVFVQGKMENQPGEVVAVLDDWSTYAYPVLQAFNIKEEPWDSIYSLDLDPE